MKKLIVVGNGMVGLKLCQKLRDRAGPDVLEIEVFGEEPRPAYDRVHLSSYFEGAGADALELAPRSWYSDNGIRLNTGEAVTDIDRVARSVFTSSGRVAEYDELVLAKARHS